MMIYRISGKSLFVFWLISISCMVGLLAQGKSTKRIHSIDFQGVEKNKESYLKQFIQSTIGDAPSDSLLLEDVQRLKNLPSIGHATYDLTTANQLSEVVFHIEEVSTFLPIVNFGGVKNNLWFQVGFYELNWRGNGSFLSAVYKNRDGQHGGQIYYRASRIKGTDWGFSASLNKWASIEPFFFAEGIVNYNYTNQELGLSVIKQFGFRNQLELGGTYFIEKHKKINYLLSENPSGPALLSQAKYLSKIEYTSDFLDYHFFYLKGFHGKFSLQNVYNPSDKSWFYSLQLSGKYFSRVGTRGNLALRFHVGVATNNNSPFAPYVVDSHVNLRGAGNRIARGTAQIISNTEYRFTLYDSKKWALQTLAFLDIGAWRVPGGQLAFNTNQFKQFVGSGFRLIYQKIYGTVLRIDYGINIQDGNHRGMVIGFDQYF